MWSPGTCSQPCRRTQGPVTYRVWALRLGGGLGPPRLSKPCVSDSRQLRGGVRPVTLPICGCGEPLRLDRVAGVVEHDLREQAAGVAVDDGVDQRASGVVEVHRDKYDAALVVAELRHPGGQER